MFTVLNPPPKIDYKLGLSSKAKYAGSSKTVHAFTDTALGHERVVMLFSRVAFDDDGSPKFLGASPYAGKVPSLLATFSH